MATRTPERVTVEQFPNIADNPDALQELTDGLRNADAVADDSWRIDRAGFWTEDGDETEALRAWDALKNAAAEEIAPDVARMLTEAINRRLPWTWEPER